MVVMIAVEGNLAVPDEEILAAVNYTRIGAALDAEAVQADASRIYELGYFSGEVKADWCKTLGGVKVVFHVVENPPLKEIHLTGLVKLSADKLLGAFTTKPGEVINTVRLARDLYALFKKAYDDNGVYLASPAQRFSADGIVEIELLELRLHELHITGLVRTKEEVVRRELSAKPGEILDLKVLGADVRRLLMRGYFEPGVQTAVIPVPGEPSMIDYELIFKERDTGAYGLELNVSGAEVLGGFFIGDSNLFGTGNGYKVSFDLNREKIELSLSLNVPWLERNHTSLNLHLYGRMADVPAVDAADTLFLADETVYGFELGLGRPLTDNLTASLTWKYQSLDLAAAGAWTGAPPAGEPPLLTDGFAATNSLILNLRYADLTPHDEVQGNIYIESGLKIDFAADSPGGCWAAAPSIPVTGWMRRISFWRRWSFMITAAFYRAAAGRRPPVTALD